MAEQITCANGHIYENDLDECPYCPKTGQTQETILDSPGATAQDETSLGGVVNDKTAILKSTADKTQIHKPEGKASAPASARKLVGWLVSFSWNEYGEDYQLREGKTVIGAANESDICVPDSEVSGVHATLLYRDELFRLKDEFSTNGTKVNGEDIVDSVELNDGDTIVVGQTEMKFRAI